jgi:hypothetical protein
MALAERDRIAAARRFAPPLLVPTRLDRRGARLRALNPKALAYVRRAGMSLSDVYPEALAHIRRLAPPVGTLDAAAFLSATGLPAADVYPPTQMSGELPAGARRGGKRWAWALAGATLGALAAGPIGLAVGGGLGWVGGAR